MRPRSDRSFRAASGQAAIEYLALIGFVLLLSAPLLLQAQESTGALETSTDRLTAVNALDTTEDAARLVYSQGEPAKVTFDIELPRGVVEQNVTGQYIRLRLEQRGQETDLIRVVPFNVTGDLPTERGQHTMVAEAVGRTNVSISEK